MSRDLSDLDLSIEKKARAAIEEMKADEKLKALGVDGIIISETKRSLTTQMAYYSRGRMDPADVKRMYSAAGLYALGDEEAKKKITWTLSSKHISGKAVDLVPSHEGKSWWNAPDAVWERMGEIGESHGLKWGGRWEQRDLPHFEI